MIKVVYPNGHEINFMWTNKKFGYVRKGKKLYRYPLPTK